MPDKEDYEHPADKDLQKFISVHEKYLATQNLEEEFTDMCSVLFSRDNLPYNPYPGFVSRLREKTERSL